MIYPLEDVNKQPRNDIDPKLQETIMRTTLMFHVVHTGLRDNATNTSLRIELGSQQCMS